MLESFYEAIALGNVACGALMVGWRVCCPLKFWEVADVVAKALTRHVVYERRVAIMRNKHYQKLAAKKAKSVERGRSTVVINKNLRVEKGGAS